jgi:hypothetical protein
MHITIAAPSASPKSGEKLKSIVVSRTIHSRAMLSQMTFSAIMKLLIKRIALWFSMGFVMFKIEIKTAL